MQCRAAILCDGGAISKEHVFTRFKQCRLLDTTFLTLQSSSLEHLKNFRARTVQAHEYWSWEQGQ